MERTLRRTETAGRTRMLVMTALFAALGCAATAVVKVPSPTGGYMNLGDTAVLLGAYFLGPVYGAAAGGIGPALADLLGGYPIYVPGTLAIKAVMAAAAGLLYRTLREKPWGAAVCGAAAEVFMVGGYWLYDGALAASGGTSFRLALAGSAAGIPSNLTQAAFGAAASALLLPALRRSGYVRRMFPGL